MSAGDDGGALTYTQLDVGADEQSQAALVTTPVGEHLLIDADTDAVADAVVSDPVADRHGLEEGDDVEYLFLTHHHEDHIGGVAGLLARLDIDKVCVPPKRFSEGGRGLSSQAASMRRRVQSRDGVELQTLFVEQGSEGPILPLMGRADLRLLSPLVPPITAEGRQNASDNNGLVFRIELGSAALLFAGDIYRRAERELLNLYGENLSATVTTLNHHGSRSSNTVRWFGTVNPEVVVAPSVPSDVEGHPSVEAVSRAVLAGSPAYIGSPYAHGHLTVRVFQNGQIEFLGVDESDLTAKSLADGHEKWSTRELRNHGVDTSSRPSS